MQISPLFAKIAKLSQALKIILEFPWWEYYMWPYLSLLVIMTKGSGSTTFLPSKGQFLAEQKSHSALNFATWLTSIFISHFNGVTKQKYLAHSLSYHIIGRWFFGSNDRKSDRPKIEPFFLWKRSWKYFQTLTKQSFGQFHALLLSKKAFNTIWL